MSGVPKTTSGSVICYKDLEDSETVRLRVTRLLQQKDILELAKGKAWDTVQEKPGAGFQVSSGFTQRCL